MYKNIIVSFGGGQTNSSHSICIFFSIACFTLLTQRHLLFVLCVHKTVNDHGYTAAQFIVFFLSCISVRLPHKPIPPSHLVFFFHFVVDFAYLFCRIVRLSFSVFVLLFFVLFAFISSFAIVSV